MSEDRSATTSLALAFGVAIVSLVVSSALFIQMQDVRRDVREYSFSVRRATAVLEIMGLTLEPGPEYDALALDPAPRPAPGDVAAARDGARLAAALGSLRNLRTGLIMRRLEEERRGYPATGEIASYADLRTHLSEYAPLAPDPTRQEWIFLSWLRPEPDRFLAVVEARDSERTLIAVTESGITPLLTR
jgi:hypothetical protein